MALSQIKKYQIITTKDNLDTFWEILQDSGAAEVRKMKDAPQNSSTTFEKRHELEAIKLDCANLKFALKELAPYTKKRGLLEGPMVLSKEEVKKKVNAFDYSTIVNQCIELQETENNAVNKIHALENEHAQFTPWKELAIPLNELSGTRDTGIFIGSIKTASYSECIAALKAASKQIIIEKVYEETVDTFFYVIYDKKSTTDISRIMSEYKFSETDFPESELVMSDHLDNLQKEIKDNNKEIEECHKELKKLAKHNEDLQIAHDYMNWELEKIKTEIRLARTNYSVVINAWVMTDALEEIEKKYRKISEEYLISEIEPDEGEKPPVVLKNNKFFTPFEAVTSIYGLPLPNEMDPTPYLSFFFILFFALCLTDAGYGLLIVAIMGLSLKFIKMAPGIKKLVKLLMYGGVVTFVVGALFGGWFGLDAAKMPESLSWLTHTTASGEVMFVFQQVNALTNPIAVLLLALGLGFIQIVTGVYMALFHNLKHGDKKKAILDHGTWAFMLTGIGVYIVSMAGLLPGPAPVIGKWWVISATIILVLTQGYEKKGIIAKFFSGLLSLYGLVGYMSDVLSYSRLLALGLATAIIGLAVNTIVELAMGIPFANWILVPIIFIGGHIFNLLINALGAFIHSGRLQFVEFFGKFMDGGGDEFKPFSKKSKYIFLKDN